jgi:hypothetical protein
MSTKGNKTPKKVRENSNATIWQSITARASRRSGETNPDDFYVYSTFGALQNHFEPGGRMGDVSAIGLNTCWTKGQRWPKSIIRASYIPGPNDAAGWAGVYWLQPDNNWGTIQNAGFDLTKYRQLIFRARAEQPGTQIKFFTGGVSKGEKATPLPHPSSIESPIFAQEADPMDGYIDLTDSWQEYHIDLTGADLHNVIDGFGWAAEKTRTPNGAVFDLDNIHFVSAAPAKAIIPPLHIYSGRFLRPGLNMGVDSSAHFTKWVEDLYGEMKASYPAGQDWGVVFITVGDPSPRSLQNSMDLRQYGTLSVELRGEMGGEKVYIGLKDKTQPEPSTETKILVHPTSAWKTYTFDLSEFTRVDMSKVYIPIEFVFPDQTDPETIHFRNIRYLPLKA